MPYLSFSKEVDVDVEIDYDDFDVDDLAKVLITKPNYQARLDKALRSPGAKPSDYDDEDPIKELVEAFRSHKPIEPLLTSLAYNRYGLIC